MKFSGKVGNEPMNKWLNFGGNPDHRLDTGISRCKTVLHLLVLFSGFVTVGRHGRWLTGIHSY